jgi:GNAT superfamily N-acetyltransferase
LNAINISQERPDSPEAQVLVEELETYFATLYPVEARYGLSVACLLSEKVAFFVLRVDGLPAGCGGVKFYGTAYAELKRMYVRPNYQGIGLGKKILVHLEAYTRHHGITTIRLETGIYQEAAIRLYQRMGYRQSAPFGDYQAGPLNLFYEKALAGHPAEVQPEHGDG